MPVRPGVIRKAKTKAPPVYKPERTEREFETNDRRWRAIRASVLMGEPLCRECRKHGLITPANEVDHINGDPMDNSPENLQPLCKPHHSQKTLAEVRARGRMG